MKQVESLTIKGLLIWFIAALFYMYEFFLRTALGTFEQPVISELALSLVSFSLISSTVYLLAYGLMQIPVGLIVDKFGLRVSLLASTLVCSLSVVAFSQVTSFYSALVFRMLSGLGSAFSFICLLVVVYEWLPRRYLALFIGLSQLIGTMGPILAAGPVNELAERGNIDWRLIFLYLGFCGLLLTFLILRFVKSMNVSPGGVHVLKVPQSMSQTIFYIFKQKQLWALALYCVSIYFTLEYLSENTGKEFLTKNGYSSSESSYFLTISWIGYAIGCPLLGLISDLSRKRKPVMFFASLLCIVSISLIIYATKIRMLVFIAFIVLGFAASGQSVGFALVSEHCRERYLASCFGFNNAAITTATSLISPMIGWLICFFSVSSVTSIFAYQKTFLIVIIFIALSLAVSMLYIEETYCRSQKEPMKLEFSDF